MEIKGRKIGKGFPIMQEIFHGQRKLYVQRRKPEQIALKYRHIRRIH